MKCNCEPACSVLSGKAPETSSASFTVQGKSWESICLNSPCPKEEKRDRKAKAVPFPSNQNQQAGPMKTKCHLSFGSPLVSIAAAALLREGTMYPGSAAEFVGVHLSPGSGTQSASLQVATSPSLTREDGVMPCPLQGEGGREGTHLVYGTWFKSVTQRQVCETFFKTSHLGVFPFSLPNLLMSPGTSGINKLTYLKHPVRH